MRKPVRFNQAIKNTSLFLLVLMILNIIRKLIFNFQEVLELKDTFFQSDQKGFMIFLFLGTIILIWTLASLIFGSLYYLFKKISYKKTNGR